MDDILQTLCQALEVSQGFIALREEGRFVVTASWQTDLEGRHISSDALTAAETTVLAPAIEEALADMRLAVPLYAGGEQLGTIVLGERISGASYADEDLDVLEDLADTVAGVVYTARVQKESVEQIDAVLRRMREREEVLRRKVREALAAEARPALLEGASEDEAISQVEDVLRHLHDYTYLGEHRLAQLRIVELHLDVEEDTFITHLDRGRALYETLTAAVEKLKPPGPRPSPATPEWYQYVILHDCYVLGKLNRDVMSDLYISHGTFSRARRRAVRGLTRALAEMEREAQQFPEKPTQEAVDRRG